MKTKTLLALLIFTFINNYIFSQDLKMCAYRDYLTEAEIKKACGFNSYMSNQKAEQVVDNILSNVGLFRNFVIKECPGISNAVAATVKSSLGSFERYIIYDKVFLDRVSGITGTDWGAISIMAHEIGHHLNGHTLIEGIDNHQAELQADEFSGFVLAKMGASLDESLSAMREYGNVNSTKSHPNKSLRIKSISNGWKKANKGTLKISNNSNIALYEYDEKQMNYFLNKANKEYKNKNYSQGAPYFVKAFQYSAGLEKLYLYYASTLYIAAKDYENALKYYLLILKNGMHSLERKQQKEIYKNIALIYISQDKKEHALKFLQIAQRDEPYNVDLIINEANIYLELKDENKYKESIERALIIDPENPTLHYNVGVVNMNKGNLDAAQMSFEKVLRIDSTFSNAALNLSNLFIEKGNVVIEAMGKLGMSKSDDAKYEKLKIVKNDLFQNGAKVLTDFISKNPNPNIDILVQLKNIYTALGDSVKSKKIGAKIDEMRGQ